MDWASNTDVSPPEPPRSALSSSTTAAIFWSAFLDGFGFGGLFDKLEMPGEPTRLAAGAGPVAARILGVMRQFRGGP